MNDFKAYLVESDAGGVRAGFTRLTDAQLDAGDVTVRVHHASVNYKDALATSGKGKIIRRFPCIAGIDAVGVVEASDSPRFRAGDSVVVHSHGFGVSHHGGYAERARVPADWVNRIPDGLTPLEAITLGVAGYTAALAVDLMELNGCAPARGPVAVNGATGGVAGVAIDMLARRGYEVVAITSKPAEAQYLRELGAASIVAASELQTGSRPLESARWAAAVDNLGGEPLAGLLRTMNKDAVIASIGNAAGIELHTTVMPFILRGVRLIGVNSDNDTALREHLWQRMATDLRPQHLDRIRRVVPFDRLPSVVDDLIAGRNRGRAVIEIDAGG
ncbi:MAG: acryloyl-CoA reductase [Proteobacteria bacterium]|nr:acryloyl-CoA reductase [Pseudomonadota bacterium]